MKKRVTMALAAGALLAAMLPGVAQAEAVRLDCRIEPPPGSVVVKYVFVDVPQSAGLRFEKAGIGGCL